MGIQHCVGKGVRPDGESYGVIAPPVPDPHTNPKRSLTPAQMDVYLSEMDARGVHLDWCDGKFVLSWPIFLEWPFRDPICWLDAEVVYVNFSALMKRFKVKQASKSVVLSLPLTECSLVFCDVETTGQRPKEDKICEISLCRIDPGQEPRWYSSLVNPNRKIKNSEIHKITDKMVKDEPKFATIAAKVYEMTSNAVFISHQTNNFDERFVQEELANASIPWTPSAKLSSLSLARTLLPMEPSHSLKELAIALSLPAPQSHRAESDVKTMMALWEVLMARAAEREPSPVTLGNFVNL